VSSCERDSHPGLWNDRVWAGVALGVYLGAFFMWPMGFGLMGFGFAFSTLQRCLIEPRINTAGEWLFGASWLANPAVWAGMVLLCVRRRRYAALAASVALLLGICAVSGGSIAPPYLLWIASMGVVVFASLRVRRADKRPENVENKEEVHRAVSTSRRLLCLAFGAPVVLAIPLIVLSVRGAYSLMPALEDTDQNENVYTADDAEERILQRARPTAGVGEIARGLPASAKDFWVFEGGSFGGCVDYWTFTCGSREDCLKAVEYLGNIRLSDLKDWKPSQYAVVMEGPGYYSRTLKTAKKLSSNPWDVRGIKNGLIYESVWGGHENMDYFAIDFDINRVFYHHESGGFPADEYDPAATTRVGN
jgi:hypothetical protein